MDWVPLVGAVGVGAVVTKLLDILWLQRLVLEQERRRWLRDKRFDAFSKLASDLLTVGMGRVDPGFVEGYKLAAEALLLSDEAVASRIDRFIIRADRMHELYEAQTREEEAKRLWNELQDEARALLAELRKAITTQ